MKSVVFLIIIFVLAAEVISAERLNFGVTPARFSLDHLLPGSLIEEEFRVYGSGREIEIVGFPWASIENVDGGGTFRVVIKVPENASYGIYEEKVLVKIENAAVNGVKNQLVLPVRFRMVVGSEDYKEFRLVKAEVFPGKNILNFRLDIDNKGNVDLSLDRVEVDVLDMGMKEIHQYVPEGFVPVPPFTRDIRDLTAAHSLEPGNYIAKLRIIDEKSVLEEDVPFIIEKKRSILERGLSFLEIFLEVFR